MLREDKKQGYCISILSCIKKWDDCNTKLIQFVIISRTFRWLKIDIVKQRNNDEVKYFHMN